MAGTIVVGIAGTEPSRVALRWATERATATGAEIMLVHVVDDDWATISPRILEEVRADAGRLLTREAEYARSLAPNLVVSTRHLYGSLMEELIAVSKSAELVAVGTHKTGFIHGRIFGSRSLVLAGAAYSPVAVIPQSWQSGARGVVVGVAASRAGRAAVRFAAAEAQRLGQTLTFVRASDTSSLSEERGELQRERDQYFEEYAKVMLSEAIVSARSVAADIDVRVRRIRRPAAEALLEASASGVLLVVGSSHHEGEGEVALGSVTHDVLINLTTPTVVVHGRD